MKHKLFCLVWLVWVAVAQATLTLHIQSPWRNDASKDGYFLHILGGAGGGYNPSFGAGSSTITTDEGDGWYSYTWNKNVSDFSTQNPLGTFILNCSSSVFA